jgi:poly(3-hydroxybutyrate) depolymerase
MMYGLYQFQRDLMAPSLATAGRMLRWSELAPLPVAATLAARQWRAALELIERPQVRHERPAFGIDSVRSEGRLVAVREIEVARWPFAGLIHFDKDAGLAQPKVLVVAPLAGHFATLLRDTIATLLGQHDVYLVDWCNARDVPLGEGGFGFDDYVDYVLRCIEALDEPVHVLAVCQPCVQVVAAVALMAASGHRLQPRSMILVAGPVDSRVNPTKVDQLATAFPMSWFERHLVSTVPARYAGAGRRVLPGFVQLSAFVAMNFAEHLEARRLYYDALVIGDEKRAEATRSFYDEYLSVLDLPAEFYLETVDRVFKRHLLARGELEQRGQRIDPAAIERTALLTIEGERDDICGTGQTLAAHELCSGLRPTMRRHHLQAGVGHYGVFSGRRWRSEVYPEIEEFVLAHN